MRRPGLANAIALLLALAALPACWPYGFAGGGFPPHIKTIAVLPFENETSSSELQREVTEAVRRGLESHLGVREAAEARADAIVRGTIVRYDVDVPIGYSADPTAATSARRQLQLTVDIEVVDQGTGKVLWQRKGLTTQGDYEERGENEGRRRSIDKLVNEVVQGAQSQW
jgi:hypothetical protein